MTDKYKHHRCHFGSFFNVDHDHDDHDDHDHDVADNAEYTATGWFSPLTP